MKLVIGVALVAVLVWLLAELTSQLDTSARNNKKEDSDVRPTDSTA